MGGVKSQGQLVFGLDIGTRSIVGTVGYKADDGFHVLAQEIERLLSVRNSQSQRGIGHIAALAYYHEDESAFIYRQQPDETDRLFVGRRCHRE